MDSIQRIPRPPITIGMRRGFRFHPYSGEVDTASGGIGWGKINNFVSRRQSGWNRRNTPDSGIVGYRKFFNTEIVLSTLGSKLSIVEGFA